MMKLADLQYDLRNINDEMPLLPIAHSKRFQARGTNVEGDILSTFGGISFYQASKRASTINTQTVVDTNTNLNKGSN